MLVRTYTAQEMKATGPGTPLAIDDVEFLTVQVTGPTSATGVNEVQIVTPGGTISGGTWTLTPKGVATSALAYNASIATIQAAVDACSDLSVGDVVVSGSPIDVGVLTLTYGGALAYTNVAQCAASAVGLTGVAPTLTPSTTTPGVAWAASAWAGTVGFQVSNDLITWSDLAMVNSASTALTTAVASTTAPGTFTANVVGKLYFRTNVTAYTSGTVRTLVSGHRLYR